MEKDDDKSMKSVPGHIFPLAQVTKVPGWMYHQMWSGNCS